MNTIHRRSTSAGAVNRSTATVGGISPRRSSHNLWCWSGWSHPLLWLMSFCLLATGSHQWANVEVTKEWKTFTFNFLPHAPIQDDNFFNPLNILATGIAFHKDRIFLATPKLFSGVPSTVNWIPKVDFEQSPILRVS